MTREKKLGISLRINLKLITCFFRIKMKAKEAPEPEKKLNMKTKIMVSLFRQKELLKKDILRKRALLEKELQYEIQVYITEKLMFTKL